MGVGGAAKRQGAALVVTLCYLVLESGCSPPPPPSILLVSLDTVRADRLGSYGGGGLTPNLDAFASESVLFEDVTAAVPLTTPSHASLLTGSLPQRHGVRNNESFRLSDSVVTMAEALRESGYRTGAFVSAFPLASRFGLDRGFDVYDDEIPTREGIEERPATEVLLGALAFVEEARRDGAPYFVFVHLFEAHSPYEPPPPFDGRYRDDPYGGEIAFLDAALGDFFDTFKAAGGWDDLAVTVVADHGESLGEHGENTHGALLYESTIRVPWISKLPGGRWAGRRIVSPVRSIDVAPTLLGALGLPGIPTADGADLSPYLGKGDVPELPIYAETLYLHLLLGWSELRSLRLGTLKLIHAPTPELYDVSEDPGEWENLFESRPRESRRRLRELEMLEDRAIASRPSSDVGERLGALGYLAGSTRQTVPETVDPKQAMAVWREIEAASSLRSSAAERARAHLERALELDPNNGLAMKMMADLALESGDLTAAGRWIDRSRAAGFHHPDLEVASVRVDLGQGRPEPAREALVAILEREPRDAVALGLFGESLRKLGRLEEAESALRAALGSRSEDARLHNELGVVLASSGKPEDARREFRRAVELAPGAPEPLTNLAALSEEEEALVLLRRAIESRPGHVRARVALSRHLAARGELTEASRHAEVALEHGPSDPEAVFVAARIADLRGNAATARGLYRRFLSLAPAHLVEAVTMAKSRLGQL